MQETFRWFGPDDPVPLAHIRMAGASGIVTALHDIYDGRVWPEDRIAARKAEIEKAGLSWSVVESIPIHNAIKTGKPERVEWAARWIETMRRLAAAGVSTICYNFMPVVDWTRTELMFPVASGGFALRFDAVDFAAYDLFVLKRPKAEADYDQAQIAAARSRFASFDAARIDRIEKNLIAGLPAFERVYDRDGFRAALADYDAIGAEELKANLAWFLNQIVPVAEDLGVRLAIHPDDPPFSLYGLPRVVSTAADAQYVLDAAPSPANGLTFCSGSYGARADNELAGMVRLFGPKIHFAHLRNVTREADGSFYEADHLDGSSDMVTLVISLLEEEARRQREGRADWEIPMRPDHGHLLCDDIGKVRINPGYSLIGRLKGLAELRGVARAASRFLPV